MPVAHLDAAYNLARWLTLSETEAVEVVQDAYLRAIRHSAVLRCGDGRAWLLMIVRNNCYNLMKQKHAKGQNEDFEEAIYSAGGQATNPRTALPRPERAELVREAMEELPTHYREV